MTRKFWIILAAMTLTVMQTMAQRQVQWGQVKTPGRQINGSTYQQGQGLPGTKVTVKGQGNKIKKIGVHKSDGTFSFPIPSDPFYVQDVQTVGYQLVDQDAKRRAYYYSKNVLELLMQKPDIKAQQEAKILKQKKAELKRQNKNLLEKTDLQTEQNLITETQRDSAMQVIMRNDEKKGLLAQEFAQRYSCLDYDQLDEFYRQVSFGIEEGDVGRVDSLLQSRGNIVEQIHLFNNVGDADSVYKEELADRCYSHYEISVLRFHLDSAAYYIELRTSLDTTNLEWLNDAGLFLEEMAKYDKAMSYFQRMLKSSIAKYGEYADWTAVAYSNVGSVYEGLEDYERALLYYQMAYDIWKNTFSTDHPVIATSYSNIGRIYNYQNNFKKARRYQNKALDIRQKTFGNRHLSVAKTLYEIGGTYLHQMEYEETDKYFEDAINYLNQSLDIHKDSSDMGSTDVAHLYNSMAGAYAWRGDFAKALVNYEEAQQIFRKLYLPIHPDIAMVYRNMGDVYEQLDKYDMAKDNMQKALEILQKVFSPNSKNPQIEKTLRAISNVEYKQALEQGDLAEFLSGHVFTAKVTDENSPAGEQDMMGEYILLEFANWTQDSPTSLYDAIDANRGTPKNMVVLKDGEIRKYYFEDKTGADLDVKPISHEEKCQIDELYRKWKETQK